MSNDPELRVFAAIVEAAPDAVVLSREGVIVYANRAAALLLGFSNGPDLIGEKLHEFIGADAARMMRERIEETLRTGAVLPPLEYEARRRDGTVVVGEVTSMITTYDGKPAVVAFVRDVTERRRLREQMARTERLAALGTAAAGVAHEINNPLQVAELAVTSIERGISSRSLFIDLHKSLERIAAIVRDLLAFSRFGDEPHEPIALAEVLASAIRFVVHQLPPRVRLTSTICELPLIYGKTRQLEQLFVNLLVNAIQAFPSDTPGGTIEITTEVTHGSVVVTVSDSGSGIPAELVDKVAEPFFTTKAAGVGTGLGLSVCQSILAAHGGELQLESEVGRGTSVRVVLPLRGTSADLARGPVVRRELKRPAQARILVCDDEPAIVRAVIQLLDGNDVVGVTDGGAAIEHIANQEFTTVICDVTMRPLSGRDVYEAARKLKPSIAGRFVFITGGAYLPDLKTFLATVQQPTVYKPFDAEALFQAIFQVAPELA